MTQIDEWLKAAGDLAEADKVDEAAEMATRVLTLEPNNYKALFVIGSVMLKVGRNTQAQQFLRRVCELMPHDHRGWGQLSISSSEMHRYDEAITYAERAVKYKREAKTLADASFAHTTAGNWPKGREFAEQSLKLDPEGKDAIFHLANCDLADKRWTEGWAGFKTSEGGKWRKLHTYGDSREWMGEPDAIVMVTGEQGVGDEIFAASVINDASKACKKFIFDCDERSGALFQRSFPNVIVSPTRHMQQVSLPVAPTHHKSLFGLLQLFRNKDADFPRTAFLKANPEYRAMFRALLDTISQGKRVIGLAWSGGYPRTGQVERTAGLTAFQPLLQREDACFVSLQYKDDAAEVAAFENATGHTIVRLPWVTGSKDMDLLASLIAELDEVVGVHTTALHISSGLGVPTTTLTHRGSGWRYAPDDILFYPKSTRLWKKHRGQSWRECVGELAAERNRERNAA